MSKQSQAGIDGCNFELVLSGVEKDKFVQPQPLLNQHGNKYGEIGVKHGKIYLSVNLPKFIRGDNVKAFSVMDMIKLDTIRDDLVITLKNLFGDEFESKLTSIECNITQKVSGDSTCSQVLNLINRSFYDETNVVYQRASSKCRHLKENETVIIRSKNYYVLKCYNKSLEQWKSGNKGVEGGILRIEIVLQDRAITKLFGKKTSISDVLQRKGLEKVIEEYRRIFVEDVINKHIRPCLTDIRKILTESLVNTGSPTETIAKHREIIVDVEVLRVALKRAYEIRGMKDNSRKIISDMKKYDLPKDVLRTVKEFHKSCGELV